MLGKSTIKIGTILPISGPASLRANVKSMLAGTQACISAVNASGGVNGRRIDLHVEDSAYDIDRTVNSARKLIEKDGVVALVNCNGTPQVEAAFPLVLEQHRTPIINTWGGRPQWFQPARAGLFGLQVLYDDIAEVLGRWAVKDGHRNILVVHPDFPAISPVMAAQTKIGAASVAEDAQLTLLSVKFGEIDPSPIVGRVRAMRPDAIIVFINQPEILALMRELRDAGLEVPIYSWVSNVAQSTIELGGKSVEGLKGLALTTATPFDSTDAVVRYRDSLQKYAPDVVPDFMSLFTFGEAQVLVEALAQIDGAVTPGSICDSLESLNDVETNILPPVGYSAESHLGSHIVQPMMVSNKAWTCAGVPIDIENDAW